MAELIAIVGGSGEGKSTSIQKLNPKETFIINVIGKPLPFKGWKINYVPLNIETRTGNYYESDKASDIINALQFVSDKLPHIRHVVVDDQQYVMGNAFMNRAIEKGFDKFTEMGRDVWLILNKARFIRKDIKAFFLWHEETITENFIPRRKIKTIGNLLDSKITLEGLFTIVLFTKVTMEQKTKENIYQFVTQSEDGSTAKSPAGMFEKYIPNDLNYVSQKIDEYYGG